MTEMAGDMKLSLSSVPETRFSKRKLRLRSLYFSQQNADSRGDPVICIWFLYLSRFAILKAKVLIPVTLSNYLINLKIRNLGDSL